jgi:hypothetical protein
MFREGHLHEAEQAYQKEFVKPKVPHWPQMTCNIGHPSRKVVRIRTTVRQRDIIAGSEKLGWRMI